MAMKLHPVANTEFAALAGATHLLELDWTDFAGNTATGLRTFSVAVTAGTAVARAMQVLVKPFKNSDTGFVSVSATLGHGASADAFMTATELCERGTEVIYKVQPTTVPFVYTADGNLIFSLTPTSAKALSDLTEGKVVVALTLLDLAAVKQTFVGS